MTAWRLPTTLEVQSFNPRASAVESSGRVDPVVTETARCPAKPDLMPKAPFGYVNACPEDSCHFQEDSDPDSAVGDLKPAERVDPVVTVTGRPITVYDVPCLYCCAPAGDACRTLTRSRRIRVSPHAARVHAFRNAL